MRPKCGYLIPTVFFKILITTIRLVHDGNVTSTVGSEGAKINSRPTKNSQIKQWVLGTILCILP